MRSGAKTVLLFYVRQAKETGTAAAGVAIKIERQRIAVDIICMDPVYERYSGVMDTGIAAA